MILKIADGDQIGFILPIDGVNLHLSTRTNRKVSPIDLNIHSFCIHDLNVFTITIFFRSGRDSTRIHHFKGYGFGNCLIFQFSVLEF